MIVETELYVKQGQGNQCQTPAGKFEEKTEHKVENKMKREETGKTGRKNTETERNWMIL